MTTPHHTNDQPTDNGSLEVPTLWRDLKPGEFTQEGDRAYSFRLFKWVPVRHGDVAQAGIMLQRPEPTNWQARAEKAEADLARAKVEALSLATSIHQTQFPEITQWRPLEEVDGIISQIDNMYAGVRNQRDSARVELSASQAEVRRLREAINEAITNGHKYGTAMTTSLRAVLEEALSPAEKGGAE